MDKASFLKNELAATIGRIAPDTQPVWGKMNLQQMTEHMAREGFAWSSGKIPQTLLTPEEQIPKLQAFIMSEKQFRENTINALMPEDPVPAEHPDMPAALIALQQEVDHFFDVFEKEPEKKIMNPFFGALDYTLSVHLLHKHATHHLKQFGITI